MRAASTPQGVSVNYSLALGFVFLFGTLAYVGYQARLREDKKMQRYKLVYTVLPPHLAATKDAIFEVGGGTYAGGKYKQSPL
jgi:hypothetical protein